MAEESLFEFLHFEIVNYCVNEKKVSKERFELKLSEIYQFVYFRTTIMLNQR